MLFFWNNYGREIQRRPRSVLGLQERPQNVGLRGHGAHLAARRACRTADGVFSPRNDTFQLSWSA